MNNILCIVLSILIFQTCISGPYNNPAYAPKESPHKSAYYKLKTPPQGFSVGVGWMQAIDIEGKGTPSKVEVDWMKLHAIIGGKDTILTEETFDEEEPLMRWYGLYGRKPFVQGPRLEAMPFTVEEGKMIIEPNTNPDLVFHWWNTNKPIIPAGTVHVWFESRIRILGEAGVQAGIDYLTDANVEGIANKTEIEAGASDWLGNSTSDWQIITVGKP